MWRNDASRRRGVATTPAKRVRWRALRRGADQQMRPVRLQLALQLADLGFVERLDHEQAVDEKAIALGRRHAAGGRVRAGDEPHLFEVRHDIANRRRRQLQSGLPRQHARPDGLAIGDVAFDQRLEQMLGARVKHASIYALIV